MNKLLIAVIAIVIIGGGVYMLNRGDANSEGTANVKESMIEKEGNMTTIRELFAQGKDIECSFSHSSDAGTESGMVFISDSKMRGKFIVQQTGFEAFTAHVIQDGEYSYTWGGPLGETQGTKVKIIEKERASTQSEGVNLDAELEFNCTDWDADSSKFIPPSNVTFADISAQVENAGEMMEKAGEMMKKGIETEQ